MKLISAGLLPALLFLYLILFPKQSSAAAAQGLLQWYQSVVPTLLPVMMASKLLIRTQFLSVIMRPLAVPARKLFGCSLYGTYALLAGCLCGCPMGARILSDLYQEGLISGEECRRLAPMINLVSPAFVVSYVVNGLYQQSVPLIQTVLLLYGGPLLYGGIACRKGKNHPDSNTDYTFDEWKSRPGNPAAASKNCAGNIFRKTKRSTGGIPAAQKQHPDIQTRKTSSGYRLNTLLDACVMESIRQIVSIGGYIVFFCVLSSVLQLPGNLPPLVRAACTGILEITGGVSQTANASAPLDWRYFLTLALLSFGGFCCALQSGELLHSFGGSLKSYLKEKAKITILVLLLALLFRLFLFFIRRSQILWNIIAGGLPIR